MAAFQYNDVTITVKPLTVGDRLDADVIEGVLLQATGDRYVHAARTFAAFVVSVTADGDIGFALPARDAESAVLVAAYKAFREADETLIEGWEIARRAAEGERQKKATVGILTT